MKIENAHYYSIHIDLKAPLFVLLFLIPNYCFRYGAGGFVPFAFALLTVVQRNRRQGEINAVQLFAFQSKPHLWHLR